MHGVEVVSLLTEMAGWQPLQIAVICIRDSGMIWTICWPLGALVLGAPAVKTPPGPSVMLATNQVILTISHTHSEGLRLSRIYEPA